jgi:hypothetical protein
MAEFMDYTMMLGITDKMSVIELEKEISRYKEKHKEVHQHFLKTQKSNSFLSDNIEGLERMLVQRKEAELKKNFVLKQEHILLLKQMDFKNYKNGGDFVFLGVEGKRPFGNSNIEGDVADICGLDYYEDREAIFDLLHELPFAINHIFANFEMPSLIS